MNHNKFECAEPGCKNLPKRIIYIQFDNIMYYHCEPCYTNLVQQMENNGVINNWKTICHIGKYKQMDNFFIGGGTLVQITDFAALTANLTWPNNIIINDNTPEIADDEVCVALKNGNFLITKSYATNDLGCSYIRILNKDHTEIGYWIYAEWQEDPILVMGAIIGCMMTA